MCTEALDLGELPNSKGEKHYTIPDDVPSKVHKILVWFSFHLGDIKTTSDTGNFEIRINKFGRNYTYPLCFDLYDQNAMSFNSDSIWLPMPFNKKICIYSPSDYDGNYKSSVKILAYSW